MLNNKLYAVIFLVFCCLFTNAQNLNLINSNGVIGGFINFYGGKGGKSVQVTNNSNSVDIVFNGEESWAGTDYSISKDSALLSYNLSNFKYLIFSIKASDDVVLEKIGIGGNDEKIHYIRNLRLGNEFKTVALSVPSGFENQKRLFSLVTTKKIKFELNQLYYSNELPLVKDIMILKPSEKNERIANANYVFSEGFETGAPSGYSGEFNGSSMLIDGNCMENPYSGRYCLKMDIDDKEAWRALFIQYSGKWTAELNPKTSLPDLSAYKKLVFYARSEPGGYLINEVGFGASSTVFSQEKRNIVFVELSNKWKKYEIDLRGLEKKSVNDVMMFSLNEGVLFLDEIRFEK